MTQAKKILKEMDAILSSLVRNAELILQTSQQTTAKDDLYQLQKEQRALVDKFTDKDTLYNKSEVENDRDKAIGLIKEIDKKIDLFQKLNSKYVENMSSAHSLIHFEKTSRKKQLIS